MARQSDGEIQSWRRKMRCAVLSGSPKVVSGGQRLNGMEKRCDWLITVMEHIATTIGLFSPSTHQHHPPALPLCTHRISVYLFTVNCRGVYKLAPMQKVKLWLAELLLQLRTILEAKNGFIL